MEEESERASEEQEQEEFNQNRAGIIGISNLRGPSFDEVGRIHARATPASGRGGAWWLLRCCVTGLPLRRYSLHPSVYCCSKVSEVVAVEMLEVWKGVCEMIRGLGIRDVVHRK